MKILYTSQIISNTTINKYITSQNVSDKIDNNQLQINSDDCIVKLYMEISKWWFD